MPDPIPYRPPPLRQPKSKANERKEPLISTISLWKYRPDPEKVSIALGLDVGVSRSIGEHGR